MRGIAGIIHFDGGTVPPESLRHLVRSMALGRFDRVEQACAGSAGLAHLQRDLTAEDRFERQPLPDAGGNLLLVTDALLENRDELADAFGWSRAEADSRPDSAFVLAAYLKWSDRCPAHLEGKWAFAAWHARERRLFAAVDHFSFRPLYYLRHGSCFAFATTLRGLLSLPQVPRDLDDEVLGDFLLVTRSHPTRTLYRAISRLPAAHSLRVTAGGETLDRYWRVDHRPVLRLKTDADYAAAFQAELDRAVTSSLRVTGDVGVMVSGGLDSAAVTAIAGRWLAERGRRLQAIHRLPPAGGANHVPLRELDESPHVRRMQIHLPHVDFHFVPPVTGRRISLDSLDTMFAEHCVPRRGAISGPPSASEAFPGMPEVNLMLFGLGGNYAVSLEEYPSPYFLQLFVQLRWTRLWRELAGHHRFYGRSIPHLVRQRIALPLLGRGDRAGGARAALLDYLNPDFVRRAGLREKLASAQRRWQLADFHVRRQIGSTIDELMPQHVGVAASVIGSGNRCAGHSPLMNHRLNEFCLSVPVDQQIRDGRDRLLLRNAMRGLLPEEVIWRRTRGFATPGAGHRAREILEVLPVVLDEIASSPLAAGCLALPELRRRFATNGESELRRIGAGRFLDLLAVACFLRWLDRDAAALREPPARA